MVRRPHPPEPCADPSSPPAPELELPLHARGLASEGLPHRLGVDQVSQRCQWPRGRGRVCAVCDTVALPRAAEGLLRARFWRFGGGTTRAFLAGYVCLGP